jgi:predicted Zn-dependent protease
MSAAEIVERALALSRADGCVVIADEQSSANLRWADNAMTTNGVTRGRSVTVVATVAGAQGVAAGVVSRSAVTADDLEPVVRAAEAAARDAGPAEDAAELVGGSAAADFAEPPAETSAAAFDGFATDLGECFGAAAAAGRAHFGFAQHTVTTTYVGSSTGLRFRHVQPTGTLELNAKSADRARSAWAGASVRDFHAIDLPALDADLAQRLDWAKRRIDLPAGRYETILPPSSVADLMIYQYWESGARNAVEGRSVFAAPGGRTRLGERLTTLPLSLRSDPAEPGLECSPYSVVRVSGDDESTFDTGLPLPATHWVRDGVLTALPASRHSARLADLPVAPPIDNLILDGGGTDSLDAMIAATDRGLLLTSLWYIREVDPATLLLTGLTRDGVYLVDHGEITAAVNNFRFNESPVDLLTRTTQAGHTTPTLSREWTDYFPRTAMPPLRVPDFNMSTVSPGV